MLNIKCWSKKPDHLADGWTLQPLSFCLFSNQGGLCTITYIMKLPTRQGEHTELCKIPKYGVNQGNIEEDTATQEIGLLDRFSRSPYIS